MDGLSILWSCIEHPESEEHDEAAVVILTKLDPPDYFSSHLKELRNMSYKYLSKELFSEEDWEGVRYWSVYVSQDDAHMNPFPCGLRKKPKVYLVMFMGVFLLMIPVLLTLVTRDLFSGRSRRVHPLTSSPVVRQPPEVGM